MEDNKDGKAVATAVEMDKSLVMAGFGSTNSFELLLRQAKMISSSSLVPEQYSIFDKKGVLKNRAEQDYALANATIAMEMAARIGASPLAVCQNLYIVQGRPSWSSQFVIAMVNACGRYTPLRFAITEPGPEREVVYECVEWENGSKKNKVYKEKIKDYSCYAWAMEKATGERLEGPKVTLEMAVKEGWMSKSGSKWKTMEGLMMRYRAAAFFGRLYAPELMMGIKTEEEVSDIIDITPGAPPAPTGSRTEQKRNKAANVLSGFEDEAPVTDTPKEAPVTLTPPGDCDHPYNLLEDVDGVTCCRKCGSELAVEDGAPTYKEQIEIRKAELDEAAKQQTEMPFK